MAAGQHRAWRRKAAVVVERLPAPGRLRPPHRRQLKPSWASLTLRPVAFRSALPPLALALRFGLSSYDASCLELALRRQLPLATQDEALRMAAQASGVGCIEAVG